MPCRGAPDTFVSIICERRNIPISHALYLLILARSLFGLIMKAVKSGAYPSRALADPILISFKLIHAIWVNNQVNQEFWGGRLIPSLIVSLRGLYPPKKSFKSEVLGKTPIIGLN